MSATKNINIEKINGLAKTNLSGTTAPTTTDDSSLDYGSGSFWIDTVADKVYFCTDATVSAATWVDVSSSGTTDTNDYTTGTTLVGSTLYFDRNDSLSAYTADLSLLLDDTNFYVTGGTVINNTLYLDRNDTLSAATIDVSSLTGETDTFVTGFTYDNSNNLTVDLNDDSSLSVNVETFSGLTTDVLNFNTGYTGNTVVEGRMYWDEENQTVSLGLHNGEVSLQLGQELHYLIKNQSGATIENGRVVRATGTLGSSGRILGEYMIADGSIPAKFTLGIATENILNGDDGYVTEFGLVRGINTTGVPYGETWNNGDVLWVSSTIPGGLTNVEPISPNLHIEVAIVIDADTKGSIFVRPHRYPYAHDIQDMGWSGGTENNLDVIQWDSALGYFNLTNTPNFNSLSATTISGGTFFGDGSNLTGVISTTGGTYTVSGATLSLGQSDGSSVSITGVTGENIMNSDGLVLQGNYTHNLSGNTLSFSGDSIGNLFKLNGNTGEFIIGRNAVDNSTSLSKYKNTVIGFNSSIYAGNVTDSVLVGSDNSVTAGVGGAIGLGHNNTLNGNASTSVGSDNSVTADAGVAVGTQNSVSNGVTVGWLNTNTSFYGITMGRGNTNTNTANINIGVSNTTTGAIQVGVGSLLNPIGNYSVLLGRGVSTGSPLQNNTANEFAVGFNETTPTILLGKSSASYINTSGSLTLRANTPIGTEDISLQGNTLINGELIQQANTSPIVDSNLSNDSFSFHIDSGTLQGRYKDNLGIVTDLQFPMAPVDVIGVVNESNGGVITYFSDLQSALETCKTGTNTVTLYSNVAVSGQINMNFGGTGVGNGYNFDELTINLNGFTLSYDGANSDSVISSDMNDSSNNLHIINGKILRTNATAGYAVQVRDLTLKTTTLTIDSNVGALENIGGSVSDLYGYLGNSIFIGRGSVTTVKFISEEIRDFKAINTSTGAAFILNTNRATNFTLEANSGDAMILTAGFADNFYSYSVSGDAIKNTSNLNVTLSNFKCKSDSGWGLIRTSSNAKWFLDNFIVLDGGLLSNTNFTTLTAEYSNFKIQNNHGEAIGGSIAWSKFYNGYVKCTTTEFTCNVLTDNTFENVTFVNDSHEVVGLFDFVGANNSVFKHCSFICEWDNASGHALDVTGIDGGNADFMNCTFEVVNSSANCIYSADAETISVGNSGFKGATTPINANVTLNNSLTTDPYGNITL